MLSWRRVLRALGRSRRLVESHPDRGEVKPTTAASPNRLPVLNEERRLMRPTVLVAVVLLVPLAPSPLAYADLPVGPGPTDYTVQAQPAPGTCHYRTAASGDVLPDPACTPGAVSPAVTQGNISTTICHKGYSKSVRPLRNITDREKRLNAKSYSYDGALSQAEYDHLIPLSIGGDPNDPRNLWVEPGDSPNPKDAIENRLLSLVCTGRMALADAQRVIATDWTTAALK